MKKNHDRCLFFFKIHSIECWEGVEDSGVKTWQPEGWLRFSESGRKSVSAPSQEVAKTQEPLHSFVLLSLSLVFIYIYISIILLLVFWIS